MAAAGRAKGTWDRRKNSFIFHLPPGITKSSMEFTDIPGYYQFQFDTTQCSGSYVSWGDYDYNYENDHFQLEKEFSRWGRATPDITNNPFRRLPSTLEHYNPARPWTVPEPRHRHSPPCRYRSPSVVHNVPRVSPCRSCSVSFVRAAPVIICDRRGLSSPPRRVNVNIMIPQSMVVPSPLRTRAPTPQRPPSLPPYSLPYLTTSSPGPSTARMDTTSSHESSPLFIEEDGSGETVIDNTCHKTPETSPCRPQWEDETNSVGAETNSMSSTSASTNASNTGKEPGTSGEPEGPPSNYLVSMKYLLRVKCDLPSEILSISEDIMDNITTYPQLHDFALKCDILRCWVERAKEDYPHDSEIMVNKVFYEWGAEAL